MYDFWVVEIVESHALIFWELWVKSRTTLAKTYLPWSLGSRSAGRQLVRKEHSCRLGRTLLQLGATFYWNSSISSPIYTRANFLTVCLESPKKEKTSKETPFPTLDPAPCTLDGANLHPSRLSLFAKFSGRFDDTVEGRWTSGVAMEVKFWSLEAGRVEILRLFFCKVEIWLLIVKNVTSFFSMAFDRCSAGFRNCVCDHGK